MQLSTFIKKGRRTCIISCFDELGTTGAGRAVGVASATNGKCFLVPVDKRDAATLLLLIHEYILSGTTIYSDK